MEGLGCARTKEAFCLIDFFFSDSCLFFPLFFSSFPVSCVLRFAASGSASCVFASIACRGQQQLYPPANHQSHPRVEGSRILARATPLFLGRTGYRSFGEYSVARTAFDSTCFLPPLCLGTVPCRYPPPGVRRTRTIRRHAARSWPCLRRRFTPASSTTASVYRYPHTSSDLEHATGAKFPVGPTRTRSVRTVPSILVPKSVADQRAVAVNRTAK